MENNIEEHAYGINNTKNVLIGMLIGGLAVSLGRHPGEVTDLAAAGLSVRVVSSWKLAKSPGRHPSLSFLLKRGLS